MVVLRKLPRRTQGRKKIEIKKLENASNKQVTFSKRRAGMFKKAAELSVLCGAHVAIIVFSTSGKVFCYGHPTVEAVLDCYRFGLVSVDASTEDGAPEEAVGEFNREYVEVMKELEEQKRKTAEAKKAAERRRRVVVGKVSGERFWWEGERADVEGMEEEEVEHYFVALEEVRKKVAARVQELRISKGLSKVVAPPVLAVNRLHHLPLIGNGFSAHQGGQFGSNYHCFGV